MRLTDQKINHLAHLVTETIENEPSLDVLRDTNDIRLRIKLIITDELKLENEIDRAVRQIFRSMTKPPPEGSKEWDVMYEQYYQEQMKKHRGHEKIRRIK
ncbi:DUF507 family protein [bacterium]|nr:DUF507 family protein [candidate division CSSED10-310 bacterium]